MATIIPGFRGYASLDDGGTTRYIRFASCTLNPTQEVEAPDMVMGDETHNAWAYGKIEVAGTISGPLTESSGEFIKALDGVSGVGGAGASIDVVYYTDFYRRFNECKLNSFTFTVTAGEVVQVSLDIIGTTMEELTSIPTPVGDLTFSEKLITWDKATFYGGNDGEITDITVGMSFAGLAAKTGLQSFTFTGTRNITRQFIIGESSLFGDLVNGMLGVTGNVVSYTDESGYGPDGVPTDDTVATGAESGRMFWDQYTGPAASPIRFALGASIEVTAAVRFHRTTTELGVGPVMSTTAFTGVTTLGRATIA